MRSERFKKLNPIGISNASTYSKNTREDSLREYLKIQDSIRIIEMSYDKDGNYAVFIDYNRNSDYYNVFSYLTKVDLNKSDLEYTALELAKFKNRTPELVRSQLEKNYQDILGAWMDIESYNNGLYVVSSCDYLRNFIITDSMFMTRNLDGPRPFVIDKIQRLSPIWTQMTLKNDTDRIIEIDFYLVDKMRDTYIIEENIDHDKLEAHYMTKVNSARKYDLIEHVCENEVSGIVFDVVNYDKILKKIKK